VSGARTATAAVVLLLAVVSLGATAPAAAQSDGPAPVPGVVVDLDADGSARATLTVTFDLTTDSDRRAFAALRDDAALRERRTAAFADRLSRVAAAAAAETGRSMRVHDPELAVVERGDTGAVSLSVTWDRLAARDGDRLVVAAPFAEGFDADGRLRVTAPDGYALADATPAPTTSEPNAATWADGTTTDGLRVAFAPAETTAGAPGFGPVVAVVALLAVTLLAVRRR
jgi:PGF-CTERM protein